MLPPEPDQALVVLVTAPSAHASRIAESLVTRHLAACVNLLPAVHSVYRWQDEVQQDAECLLIIKTAAGTFESLRQAVLQMHPYELPEVIALPLAAAHPPYLAWVLENSRGRA